MQTVGAFEAKAKIAELLDRVAAGESVLITRRGTAAALLVPPGEARHDRLRAMEAVRTLRARCHTGKIDIEALIAEDRP